MSTDNRSSNQEVPFGRVLLRGKVWEIINIAWCGAEPDVGIMSDYVDSYDLQDDDGNRWDWDKEQLTSAEEKSVDEVLYKLARYYVMAFALEMVRIVKLMQPEDLSDSEEVILILAAEIERLTRELGTEKSGHLFTVDERNWALAERDRLTRELSEARNASVPGSAGAVRGARG